MVWEEGELGEGRVGMSGDEMNLNKIEKKYQY